MGSAKGRVRTTELTMSINYEPLNELTCRRLFCHINEAAFFLNKTKRAVKRELASGKLSKAHCADGTPFLSLDQKLEEMMYAADVWRMLPDARGRELFMLWQEGKFVIPMDGLNKEIRPVSRPGHRRS